MDIGNTLAKYTLYDGDGNFGEIKRCSSDGLFDELNVIFHSDEVRKGGGIHSVAISNVGRELSPQVVELLHKCAEKVILVKGDMPLPVKINYLTPQTLGADRICAVLGAASLFPGENSMIFDFGTATTIDFLKEGKEYLGGNISLGLSTRLKAIHHYTSKLPLLETDADYEEIGRTTSEAVAAGIILGIIYEIEAYISKYPDYKIIFTGGDAFFFEKKIKNRTFVVPNLVFMGLVEILKFYES